MICLSKRSCAGYSAAEYAVNLRVDHWCIQPDGDRNDARELEEPLSPLAPEVTAHLLALTGLGKGPA